MKYICFQYPFENGYGYIGIFGDTFIVDDYNYCKPYDKKYKAVFCSPFLRTKKDFGKKMRRILYLLNLQK